MVKIKSLFGIMICLCFVSALGMMLSRWKISYIPVVFNNAELPAIRAQIEEKEYILKFDLGSKFLLSLDQEVLASIQDKEPAEKAHFRDMKGNFYESRSYRLPKMQLQDLTLTEVQVNEESRDFNKNTTFWKGKTKKRRVHQALGTLGRPILKATNLLLNFENRQMIACNNKIALKKAGFLLDKVICIPFSEEKVGVIINVDTDVGRLRLSLDTGATVTFVRASGLEEASTKEKCGLPVVTTKKFAMGKHDFGSKDLFLLDITPELDSIDGVLGMDFLRNHVVYIDYQHHFLYVDVG